MKKPEKKPVKKVVKRKKVRKLTEHEKNEIELAELEKEELITGDGYHTCSDGTVVSYRGWERNIRIKMAHLTEDEILDVIAINSKWKSLQARINILKRKLNGGRVWKGNSQWATLLKERKEELLELFGKMYNGAEVHRIVTSEWGFHTVHYINHILKFQRENVEVIAKLQEKYQDETKHVRLVHKRSRLDELSYIYQSHKEKYEEVGSKHHSDMMMKALEQVRKEVEGNSLTINGHIKVEHEMAIQEHVNTEIFKGLNINDIIIGRLCSRLKVNPKYILYRLHTSYYSKFTGFLPDEMGDDNELAYPSQVVYDFDRMRERSNILQADDVDYKDEPEIVDQEKIVSGKEKLKMLLQQKKKHISAQRKSDNKTVGK